MKTVTISVVCVLALGMTACLPVTNTYQTARVLEPGAFEVTAGLAGTRTTDFDDGYNETQVTAQVNAGLADRLEGRVMVGLIKEEAALVSLALKAELIEDTLALDVPVGTLFGADLDPLSYLSVHPALVGTHRFNPNVEVSASVRASFFSRFITSGDGVGPFSATVGLGLSSDLNRWAIRPEVGVGTFDFDQQTYVSAGVGVTGLFGP